MRKKLQLQIPIPCHENWENMTRADKGRFYASCQKQVIDFSNMSDREIALFFKKPILSLSKDGSVCGRFMEDQLNKEIEIPRKRIPWVKYFFQFTLPAFLISMKATAQKQKPKERIIKEVCTKTVGDTIIKWIPEKDIHMALTRPRILTDMFIQVIQGKVSYPVKQLIANNTLIKGKIIDDKGNAIPYSTVTIKGTNTGVIADLAGNFSIVPNLGWESITLVALSVGYTTREVQIDRSNYGRPDSLVLIPIEPQLMGDVVIVRKGSRKKQKPIPVLQQILKDTVFSKFRIYPNPVQSNSTPKVEWRQKEFDNHIFQLFNQSGQLVFTKEIYIDGESGSSGINLPSVPPGSYFLKMTSIKTGKSYTEKLIIK
jgi:hypothetical protein